MHVKQAKVCIGREVEKYKRWSRFRIVQEWNVRDENTTKMRSTSRNCQRVLLFSAISEACPNCYNTKDYVPSKQKDKLSDDEMANELFPGACDTMKKHLHEQNAETIKILVAIGGTMRLYELRCLYGTDPHGYY